MIAKGKKIYMVPYVFLLPSLFFFLVFAFMPLLYKQFSF